MTYRVKLRGSSGVQVRTFPAELIERKLFSELDDVDISQLKDKYVIMYNSSTQKYTAVNPDDVLTASAISETSQPGLPSDFINTLDVNLDNKIDLDGGEF